MPVDVGDRTHAGAQAEADALHDCAEKLLDLLDRTDDELDVILVDDAEIRDLNRSYRSRDRATDVLSFSQLEQHADDDSGATSGHPDETVLLGDVVISIETAARQAAAGGWALDEELNRLLLHGLLHLLGYDHEAGPEQERIMTAEESRLAGQLVTAGFSCAREGAI